MSFRSSVPVIGRLHDAASWTPFSSCRRHHGSVSVRPFGARSSHWNVPQSPSRPRAAWPRDLSLVAVGGWNGFSRRQNVFDAAPLLFPGEPDADVRVAIAADARCPRERPHPTPLGLQRRERRARDRREHHVVLRKINGEAVDAVDDRRAGWAPAMQSGRRPAAARDPGRGPPALRRRGRSNEHGWSTRTHGSAWPRSRSTLCARSCAVPGSSWSSSPIHLRPGSRRPPRD